MSEREPKNLSNLCSHYLRTGLLALRREERVDCLVLAQDRDDRRKYTVMSYGRPPAKEEALILYAALLQHVEPYLSAEAHDVIEFAFSTAMVEAFLDPKVAASDQLIRGALAKARKDLGMSER